MVIVDARPLIARGEPPLNAIETAVAKLKPGQSLVVLAPFNPVPLYEFLAAQGFSHRSRQIENGGWRVEFRRDLDP